MNVPPLSELVFAEVSTALERQQLSERLWLTSEKQWNNSVNIRANILILYSSPCGGGAYNQFGTARFEESRIKLELKTVWGIIRHRFSNLTYYFDFCDPCFPDNIIIFVKEAAKNSQRTFDLSHKRSCKRRYREMSATIKT